MYNVIKMGNYRGSWVYIFSLFMAEHFKFSSVHIMILSLMALGKKMFPVLAMKACMLCNLLLDGRWEKRMLEGCVGAFTMLVALRFFGIIFKCL